MMYQTTLISLARDEVRRRIKDDKELMKDPKYRRATEISLEKHKEMLEELNQMAREIGLDAPLSQL